jgi:hypothetical protein
MKESETQCGTPSVAMLTVTNFVTRVKKCDSHVASVESGDYRLNLNGFPVSTSLRSTEFSCTRQRFLDIAASCRSKRNLWQAVVACFKVLL